jgi:hypothetical protein
MCVYDKDKTAKKRKVEYEDDRKSVLSHTIIKLMCLRIFYYSFQLALLIFSFLIDIGKKLVLHTQEYHHTNRSLLLQL